MKNNCSHFRKNKKLNKNMLSKIYMETKNKLELKNFNKLLKVLFPSLIHFFQVQEEQKLPEKILFEKLKIKKINLIYLNLFILIKILDILINKFKLIIKFKKLQFLQILVLIILKINLPE